MRYNYYDFLQPLAELPESNIPKVAIPEHLTKLLDNGSVIQIIPVACTNSFLHSILHILYPRYSSLSWSKKQNAALELSQIMIPEKLQINLVVVTSTTFFCDIIDKDAVCIILYRDDLNVYFPINLNGNLLTSSLIDPEVNKFYNTEH